MYVVYGYRKRLGCFGGFFDRHWISQIPRKRPAVAEARGMGWGGGTVLSFPVETLQKVYKTRFATAAKTETFRDGRYIMGRITNVSEREIRTERKILGPGKGA